MKKIRLILVGFVVVSFYLISARSVLADSSRTFGCPSQVVVGPKKLPSDGMWHEQNLLLTVVGANVFKNKSEEPTLYCEYGAKGTRGGEAYLMLTVPQDTPHCTSYFNMADQGSNSSAGFHCNP